MDFELFTEKLLHDLGERFGTENVRVAEIEKLQGESYRAVSVKQDGGTIGVNVNASELYGQLEAGADYYEILETAAERAEQALENVPEFNIHDLTEYENIRGKLTAQVVSTERNLEMLEKIPHKEMEDLSVVYRIQMDESGSILITNDQLKSYGISAEQLHQDAVENAAIIRPAKIRSLSEVLGAMMGLEPPDPEPGMPVLYMASAEGGALGAGVIAYPEFMDQAAAELGGSFYILPSSVHEVLLVRDNENVRVQELNDMVKGVNETTVAPEERLADEAYHYDAESRVFERASDYEARSRQEKEISVLSIRPNMYPEEMKVGNSLEDLQLAVSGYIEVVHPFDDQVALIVNEEGKLHGLENNRAIRDEQGEIIDIISGSFLVVGDDGDKFRSLTPEELKKFEEKFHQPEAFVRMGKKIMAVPVPDETLSNIKKREEQLAAGRPKKQPVHDGH